MRYCRAVIEGVAVYAELGDRGVSVLTAAPWAGGVSMGASPVPVEQLKLLAPVQPSKIVCVGQNYRKHAEEMGKPVPEEPLLFLKAGTSLNDPDAAIILPPESSDVQHEAELGLVIGQRLSRATEAQAAAGIFGLTCVNDVTARDIQRREIQHTRAKSYDTFAPVGPWITTGASWDDLEVICRVNGQVRQQGRTSDMIFSPVRLVSFISSIMTLLPGDLISTGTPSGVGRLVDGDRVEIEVGGMGTLANVVRKFA